MSDWKKIFVGGVLGLIYMLPSQIINALFQTGYYFNNINSLKFNYYILIWTFGAFLLIVLLSIIFGSFRVGYYIRLAKNTVIHNDNELPEWENWGDLFKKGILYYVGSILIIMIIFIPITVILMLIGYAIYINSGGNFSTNLIYIFIALGIYLLAIIFYVLYIFLAAINYANVGFSGFFEFKKIIDLMSLKYILLIIILTIINMVLSFIASLPSIIINFGALISNNMTLIIGSAIIDTILMSFIGFFISVAIYRSISIYYKEKMQEKGYC